MSYNGDMEGCHAWGQRTTNNEQRNVKIVLEFWKQNSQQAEGGEGGEENQHEEEYSIKRREPTWRRILDQKEPEEEGEDDVKITSSALPL